MSSILESCSNNGNACVVWVSVSNQEQKYKQKFIHIGELTVSRRDADLYNLVKEALGNFKGDVDGIKINVEFVWD